MMTLSRHCNDRQCSDIEAAYVSSCVNFYSVTLRNIQKHWSVETNENLSLNFRHFKKMKIKKIVTK